jgi:hypothetical protein
MAGAADGVHVRDFASRHELNPQPTTECDELFGEAF